MIISFKINFFVHIMLIINNIILLNAFEAILYNLFIKVIMMKNMKEKNP